MLVMNGISSCRNVLNLAPKNQHNRRKCQTLRSSRLTEPDSLVGKVAVLRKGGRWFDPRLGQYSFRGLMLVIATGFISLLPLSVVSTLVMWESSQWLGKNSVRNTG